MEESLYIHIPFCRRKCLYCDFYSEIADERLSSDYIDVILNQAGKLSGDFSTIYIGGGTPSALSPKQLEKLLTALGPKLRRSGEFTCEANPESLDGERLKILLGSGVNRLSIGVQSLDDRKLKRLGRLHDARKAAESVSLAAKGGFANIGIDLMFGVWDEKPQEWKRELEEAARLPVTHVSCYSLTYEEGTPLHGAISNKSVRPIDDDISSAMYEAAIDLLAVRGFKQYEISNFSRDGFRCRHNINYWENGSYAGLGASAVSYSEGVRAKSVPDVREYIRRYGEGRSLVESSEKLTAVRRAKETAAVKIRTRDGINFRWFREKTGYDFPELERRALAELLEKDLVKYIREGDLQAGIALKRRGILCCDAVSAALL